MKGPQWRPLITVLLAVVHCLALVNQENSDHTNLNPQDTLGSHKVSKSSIGFAFSLYRWLTWTPLDRTFPSPQ